MYIIIFIIIVELSRKRNISVGSKHDLGISWVEIQMVPLQCTESTLSYKSYPQLLIPYCGTFINNYYSRCYLRRPGVKTTILNAITRNRVASKRIKHVKINIIINEKKNK